MNIKFQALQKEDKPIFDKFFREKYYENSHFTFTNLYMWREAYHIHWSIEDDVLFVMTRWHDRYAVLQPFGKEENFFLAIAKQLAYFEDIRRPFFVVDVDKNAADLYRKFPDKNFIVEARRDDFDYVYATKDLINLSGRKYHSKKNHVNSFYKTYSEAQYLPITEDIIMECKLNINAWFKMRKHDMPDDPFLQAERTAVIEVLNNFDEFKLKGAALRLGKRIVAFTFGEELNRDTAVIHVEKADSEIRGAYPVINQAFLRNEWSHLPFVNREEDMGIEGLRIAKESYKPLKMIEKFTVSLAK